MDENLTAWNRLKKMVLTTDQVRNIDRMATEDYAMNSLVLMENAAIGCVHWLLAKFSVPQQTTILCGRGNNGGDGLAIARHLTNCGWPCRVYLLGPVDRLSPDALANFRILSTGNELAVTIIEHAKDRGWPPELNDSELIVDAMLGTGAKGDPRPPLDIWIEAANASAASRVAIDIPTGVDAETGICGKPTFKADATLTFVAHKPGMRCANAARTFGQISVLPIGLPSQLIRAVVEQGREGVVNS